jgi:hypothetical protein
MGHHSYTSDTVNFGGTNIEFTQNMLPLAKKVSRPMNFSKGINASICDANGQILFYTNGCFVADRTDQMMENGDSINVGEVFEDYCDLDDFGYVSGFQSAVVLPKPGNDMLYYLFHKRVNYVFNPFDLLTLDLLYSVMDMSQNGGLGKVVEKNVVAFQDTLAFGDMTAVRHANGTDWWLVTPGYRNNKYFVFLFDASGLSLAHSLALGDPTPPAGEGGGQCIFSPSGETYIRFNPHNKVRMFHFDRNTGLLSNYRRYNVNFFDISPFAGACGISPSGRYLYISAQRDLYQMDLWASDIEASQTLIGTWDGYADPFAANFGRFILGPDCKLYIFPHNDSKAVHIIHNPDGLGMSCEFVQHDLVTPTYHGGDFPNFPDFRLGALGTPLSPCAGYTVGGGEPASPGREDVPRVFPNPAGELLTVEYSPSGGALTGWFTLRNTLGQVVLSERLIGDRLVQPVGHLPEGLYVWELMVGGKTAQAGKVLIAR